MTDEESDESDYEATPDFSPASAPSVDHHAFILGYRSADVNLAKCYPLPSHVPFLWSVYQENVEPLVKLVHVPTTEELFRNVRRNQSQLTPGQECLVFAIYYAAINSLDADEVSRVHLLSNQSTNYQGQRFKPISVPPRKRFSYSIALPLSKPSPRRIFYTRQTSWLCKRSRYSS